MAQFDVYRTQSRTYPLVIDVQDNLHALIDTRVVVPLVDRALYNEAQPGRLTPIIEVRGLPYVAVTYAIASVPRASLGRATSSVIAQRPILLSALDILLTGS